ncbi:MAG: SpoIIE family protein phosphatase [Candidatus Eisenbacteria bacterium]
MALVKKVFRDRSEKSFHLNVPGEERYLGQIRDFIDEVCSQSDVPSKTTNSIKLAVDEACANIIKHAYRVEKGSIDINITAAGPNNLVVSLTDKGESFELQRIRTPDLRRYVATGRKGGLGLYLMNRLMDEVSYDVTESGNVLVMKKNLLGKRKRLPMAWRTTLWHKSLRFRFSLYASGVLLAIVVAAFSYFVVRQDRTMRSEMIARSRAVSEMVASQSVDLLLLKQALSVEQTLLNEAIAQTRKENSHIASIVVVDGEGNIWASDRPSELFAKFAGIVKEAIAPGAAELLRARYSHEEVIPLSTPVVLEPPDSRPTELGTVHVGIRRNAISEYAAKTRRTLLGIAILVLSLGNVAIWYVVSFFIKPLQKLSDGVRAIGEGMLDRRLEEGGPDEIDEIARTFNEITARFRKAQHSMVEKERLQKEMQVAQEIQQSLLPREVPNAEGFEIGTLYRAAKEVGGDYFDFLWVDDDTLGVVVADVSGKGVPGSLVMTMIRTALRMEARDNKSAKEVVARLNNFVTEDMKRGMFVTIFYVILDSRHRIISYSSAGHNPMILYRGDSDETYFLNPKGFPVGIDLADRTLFEKSIGAESIKLKQSDMLVIYTDGITEAMDKDGGQFGEERLIKTIKRFGHLTPQEFADRLDAEIAEFTGGELQNDDITLVAIKEKAVADDILYDVRKKLIGLVEVEGMSVKEACEIMKVSPSSYYRYKRRMEELGEEGLKDRIPRAAERLGRVSLEVQQRILQIIKEFPAYGPKRMSRELAKSDRGGFNVPSRKVYECLRGLGLGSKGQRKEFAADGRKKIMNLEIERGQVRTADVPGPPDGGSDSPEHVFDSSEDDLPAEVCSTIQPPSVREGENNEGH